MCDLLVHSPPQSLKKFNARRYRHWAGALALMMQAGQAHTNRTTPYKTPS
ncbi:hypothetical protein HHE03_02630 [Helicobacter heilmannii]|nr:hypothetical protein HHE03_02630 [Helicobacter heilmannii]